MHHQRSTRHARSNHDRILARGGLAAGLPDDALLLAYQTLLIGYLEPEEHAHYREGMMEFLASQNLWIELASHFAI